MTWAAMATWCAGLTAAERLNVQPQPQGEVVELFAGVEKGQIEAQFIAADAAHARLIVTNKTDRPLSVKLPPAFAAVPVLAQFVPMMPMPRQPRVPNQPAPFAPFPAPNQPVAQRVGAGPAQALMNIPVEMVGQLKIATVCLDYGATNPRPAIKYEAKPIAQVTDKPGVAEVCEMLGRGEIGPRAAQLAAWHIVNDMSWEKLAGLRKEKVLGRPPTYTSAEINAGKKAADKAVQLAQRRRAAAKPEAVSAGPGTPGD